MLHPYIDLVLRLRAQHGLRPADVVSIECPVAEFNVSIVCEPVAEKTAPATEAHCRVCLQYTLAEALVRGELGRTAYADAFRTDPEILALARRVTYRVDPSFPPPGRFKGAVTMHARRRPRVLGGRGVQPRLGRESDDRGRAARQVRRQRGERPRRRRPATGWPRRSRRSSRWTTRGR